MSSYTHIDSQNPKVKKKVDETIEQVLTKLTEMEGGKGAIDYVAFMPSAREGQVRQILRALYESQIKE